MSDNTKDISGGKNLANKTESKEKDAVCNENGIADVSKGIACDERVISDESRGVAHGDKGIFDGNGDIDDSYKGVACGDKECGGTNHRHDELVKNAVMNMPDEGALCDLAEFFKIFADSTRVKILYALKGGEMCVCCICQSIGLSQSAVSHQLRILKHMRLVKYRREGKMMYYSLTDSHIHDILSQGMEHIME